MLLGLPRSLVLRKSEKLKHGPGARDEGDDSHQQKAPRLAQHNEMSINKPTRSYRYLSCRVAVRPRPEENDPPSSLHLRHYFAVAEAKERSDTKALFGVKGNVELLLAIYRSFFIREYKWHCQQNLCSQSEPSATSLDVELLQARRHHPSHQHCRLQPLICENEKFVVSKCSPGTKP